MTRLSSLLAAVLALTFAMPASAQLFAGEAPLPDAQLAKERGRFTLPGGVRVAIGIAIETRLNGDLLLRTAVNSETPGVSVTQGAGVLTISRTGSNTIAQVSANNIAVSQLVGASVGTIIANTGNDRVIDTVTTVNIDLSGQVLPPNFLSTLEGATRAPFGR